MKPIFDQYSDMTIRALSLDDAQAYRDYYKSLSNPHHFKGHLAGKDIDVPKTIEDFFNNVVLNNELILFGLFHNGQMIGQTSIGFAEDEKGPFALLAGSEITDEYRGNRLVDIFYQTRLNHLKDIGYDGRIIVTIHPDNVNSHKVATRNGFVTTGEFDHHGYDILTPKR